MKTHTTDSRIIQIAGAVTATAEVLGREITPIAVELIATDLAEYADDAVIAALRACRRELTGRLTLAAILERIAREDGHPEPNAAWAIALKSSDEAQTAVLTNQILTAMTEAQPVLDSGDKIGARMAFLDAYRRLVEVERENGRPAKWFVSAGTDPAGRAPAIEQARAAGLLSDETAQHALLEHTQQPVQQSTVSEIAGLLAGKPVNFTDPARAREILAGIKKSITDAQDAKAREQQRQADDLRERKEKLQESMAGIAEVAQ